MRYLLVIFILLQCSPPHEKKEVNDAYGEYDIADPPTPETTPKEFAVEIKQMKFTPEVIRVQKGDKITWINKDMVDHDVTELATQAWTSSKLKSGISWSMTATKSENYYCNLHVVMRGQIIVDGSELTSAATIPIITVCQ